MILFVYIFFWGNFLKEVPPDPFKDFTGLLFVYVRWLVDSGKRSPPDPFKDFTG